MPKFKQSTVCAYRIHKKGKLVTRRIHVSLEREREENEKKALAGQSPTLGHFSRKACVLQLGGAAFVSLHDILTLRSSH